MCCNFNPSKWFKVPRLCLFSELWETHGSYGWYLVLLTLSSSRIVPLTSLEIVFIRSTVSKSVQNRYKRGKIWKPNWVFYPFVEADELISESCWYHPNNDQGYFFQACFGFISASYKGNFLIRIGEVWTIMGQSKQSLGLKVHGDVSIWIKADDLRDLTSLKSKGATRSVYWIPSIYSTRTSYF